MAEIGSLTPSSQVSQTCQFISHLTGFAGKKIYLIPSSSHMQFRFVSFVSGP